MLIIRLVITLVCLLYALLLYSFLLDASGGGEVGSLERRLHYNTDVGHPSLKPQKEV
jgi:hypothetical protein